MMMTQNEHIDQCDSCGEVSRDIDAGFCPSLQEMGHSCGGKWVRTELPLGATAGNKNNANGLCAHCGEDILIPAADGQQGLDIGAYCPGDCRGALCRRCAGGAC